MPHHTLTKIIGEPTHAATKKLERELAANLIAVDCSWGINRGHLGELLPAAIFIARYGAPCIPPAAAPPPTPSSRMELPRQGTKHSKLPMKRNKRRGKHSYTFAILS